MNDRAPRACWVIPLATMLAATVSGCGSGPREPTLRGLESPAPAGSRVPNLSESGGTVHLSWIEESADDGAPRLRFSVREDDGWSEPQTIVEDALLFVNWADFPVVASGDDGGLVAAWPANPRRGSIGYGLRFSGSSDDGASWSAPQRPHEDDSATEHSFISIVPAAGGTFDVVWLDGLDLSTQHDLAVVELHLRQRFF